MNAPVVVRPTPGDGPHFGILINSGELRFLAKIHSNCCDQAEAEGFYEAAEIHMAVRDKLISIADAMSGTSPSGAAFEAPPLSAGDYEMLAGLHELLASITSHADVVDGRSVAHDIRSTEIRAAARRARSAEPKRGAA